MFYDPAVVGETVDTVRVMNYDMCKLNAPCLLPADTNRLANPIASESQTMARG